MFARAGPGVGAGGGLTTIDPAIERPVTREFVVGIEVTPPRFVRTRLTAISRRRSHQVALLNVGVPASGYDVFTVPDPGPDRLDPADDQLLPIYNRVPETFGMDRFLLSNSDQPATFRGVTLIFDRATPRVYLAAAGVMAWTDAAAGHRGFGPAENDAGVVGELLTDPNAATHARGNVFADRQVRLQGRDRIQAPVRPVLRRGGAVPGRAALFEDGRGSWPESGNRRRSGVSER